jgi:hypothetical protein
MNARLPCKSSVTATMPLVSSRCLGGAWPAYACSRRRSQRFLLDLCQIMASHQGLDCRQN